MRSKLGLPGPYPFPQVRTQRAPNASGVCPISLNFDKRRALDVVKTQGLPLKARTVALAALGQALAGSGHGV